MTYALLASLCVAVAGGLAVAAHPLVRRPGPWWSSTVVVGLVLLVLTAVFDSLMILTDLFRYQADALAGLRIFVVPVEDFAWPVCAVLALPALWELLGRFGRRARDEH